MSENLKDQPFKEITADCLSKYLKETEDEKEKER